MTKPYELLARFAEDGTVAGCHVRTIGTDPNGRKYESDPIPLKDATDPAFTKFAEAFSASAVAENEVLKLAKAKLGSDLETKTTEYDTTKTSLDAKELELTSSKEANAKLVTDHTEALTKLAEEHKTAIDAKQSELDTTIAELRASETVLTGQLQTVTDARNRLLGQLAESSDALALANSSLETANKTTESLIAKIEVLKTAQRFDPRKINALAFYNRITKDEFAKLSASDDPQLRGIAKAIDEYVANEKTWAVEFDSEQMQGMVGYLLQTEFLTQYRAQQLTQDATWQEAYYPK